MNSIRNRLVAAVLLVLACAAVAAGIHEQRQSTMPNVAAVVAPFPTGASFRDPSVPAASVVFEGAKYVPYEEVATF